MLTARNNTHEPFDEVKVGKWLRQDEGRSFINWLRDKREQEITQLTGHIEVMSIGRSQGRVDMLDRILRIVEGI